MLTCVQRSGSKHFICSRRQASVHKKRQDGFLDSIPLWNRKLPLSHSEVFPMTRFPVLELKVINRTLPGFVPYSSRARWSPKKDCTLLLSNIIENFCTACRIFGSRAAYSLHHMTFLSSVVKLYDLHPCCAPITSEMERTLWSAIFSLKWTYSR